MDFFGSMFSTISLGMLFRTTNITCIDSCCCTAFRDEIDALDLANYIAIACFDVGILVLYYMFEWYHKRKGVTGNDEDKTQNSKELSHNCETAPEIQTVQSAETFDLKLKG